MVLKYDTSLVSLNLNIEMCIGCQLCVEVCPHDVFELNADKANIKMKDRCIECGACANNCPTDAITVNSGVGCAQAFINSYFNGGEVSCDCSATPSDKKGCC